MRYECSIKNNMRSLIFIVMNAFIYQIKITYLSNVSNVASIFSRYSIMSKSNATTSSGKPLFQIDEASGIITTARELDGNTGFFSVVILATNLNANHSAEQEIVIEIVDVNDDLPTFIKPTDGAIAYVLEVCGTNLQIIHIKGEVL